jgi:hypothetical protein
LSRAASLLSDTAQSLPPYIFEKIQTRPVIGITLKNGNPQGFGNMTFPDQLAGVSSTNALIGKHNIAPREASQTLSFSII